MALPPYDRRGLRRTDDELLDRTSIQETDYEALDKANAASMGSFRRGRMQHDIQRDANRQYSEAAEARREGKADWEEERAKGNEYARQAAAYAGPETDLRNVKGLGDLGAFSAFHFGSESDNLLTGLAGGALMGAGKKTKIKALTRAGQGLVGYQAADDYVQGVDSIQGEQLNDPDMLKADPNDALTAARIGGGAEIATGLVPVASGMKVAGRVLSGGKPGSRLAAGLAGTGTAFVAEGTTEVGADLVSHAANVALANKQKSLDPWDLANSFAAGGVVGGGTHAGADYVGDILQGGVAAVRGAKNQMDAKRAAPSTPGAEPGAESPKGKTGWERIRPDFMSGDRAPVDLNDDEGLVARTKAATTNAYSAAKDAAAGVFKDTPHSVSVAFAQAKEYAGKVREQGREAFAEYVEPKWNEFIETREARRAEVEAATAPLYESADNVEFESVWAAARDTVSNVVDEASVMINDALVAMDSMKRDVKDPQFDQVDGAVKSVKAELDDIKSELASIAEEESANLSASSIDVGVSPAQRKKMREKQAAKAGELTERKKTVAQRAKQATEYLGRMAEEGILDATAVVARTRKAASKYTPSWDFRFNGEDYGLGGEFFDAKLKAMSSVVDDVKLGGGRAIDALSNIFGSGRDVADAQSLLSGMDEAAILGADPAETAANMARSAAKNVELATKFRNSLLKENKLPEGSLTKLMQLNPADPADQKGIAQMYLDQSKVQEMEQTLRDVESQMGEDGEAKMSLIGMDKVDPEFVSALSKLLGPSNASKAPVMALRIIRAATFLGDPTQFRAGFANELKSKISVASMVSDPESFFNRTIDASGVTVGKGDRYEMAQAVDAAARKHYDKSLDISDENMATLETMYKVLEADSSEDRHGPIRGLLAYYAAVHATGEQRDITKGNMNVAVLALSDALTTRFQYSVEEMDPSGRLSELVEQYLPAEKAPNVDKTKLDGQSFTYRTAVSDVGRAREESFLWGLMAGNLGTDAEGFETMTMNVASFVDTNAVNFAQMDEFRQSQVLKTLITAVGDEESARSVLTYYGVAARMMIEQQQARDKEMGITALEDGAEVDSLITQMAERSDTTTEAMYKEAWDVAGPEYDEEAQKGVVEADEADPNSGFQTFDADSTENSDVMYNQDSKSKRPFLKGREKDDAALAELLEELGPEARVRNYGEVFAAERRASTFDGGGKNSVDVQTAAMSELTRMVAAVKAVRDEHYKKDRGIQESMLAEMEARAAKEPLTVENHRKMVALRKKVAGDNLEDRSAMIAVNDAEIKAIEDGMIKAREAANEKRKTDPTAEADYVPLLDMYQVVTTPNDGQGATNEDLRAYRADSNGANTPVIKFKFKSAGGKEYTRNLSPVAMVKSKDASGYTTHERLASVMAKVMNRSDYVGFEDPGVGYKLGLKEHGHAFRWGDFISAQSQVDLDAMTEASIAKFMEPLESDAVKSTRIDARKEAGPKPEPEKTLAERLVDRAFGVEEAAARKEKDTQFGKSQGAIQADEAKEGVLNMLNAITIETGFKPSEELASEYSKAMAVGLEKANAEVAKLEAEVNAVNNQESPAYRRAMKRYQEAKVKRNKLANRLNDASIEDGVLRDWKDYGKERTELARARMQALLKGGTAVNGKLSQLQAAHDALSNKQTKEAKALMRQIYELRAKNKELARAARSYAEALNPWDSEAYQEQRDIQEALDDERGSYANLYPKVAMAEAEIDALRAQIESLRLGLKTGDANDTSKFRNKGKVRKVAEGTGEVWDFAAKPIQERLKKAETELDILMRSIPREERDRMRIVDDVATGPTKGDIGLAGVSLDTAVEMTGATYLANSFFGLNKKDDEAGGVTPENLYEVAGILPALHAALSAKGVASLPPAERKLYDKIDALLTEVAKREGSNPADLTKLIRSGKNFGQNLGSGRTNEGKEARRKLWIGAVRAIRKGMSDDQISAISGIKADRVVDLGYVDAVLFARGNLSPEQVLKASAMIPRVVESLGEQDPSILSEQELSILNAARAYSRGRGTDTKSGALFEAVNSQDGLTQLEKRQLWLMANAASLGQDAPTPTGDDLSARASLMKKMAGKKSNPVTPEPEPPKGGKNTPAKRKAMKDKAAKDVSTQPAAGLLPEGKMSLASTPLSQRTDAELADIKERAIRGILQSRGDGVTVTFGSLASIGGAGKYKHDVETRYREIQIALDVADPLGAARHEVLHDFLRSFGASDANRALKKQLLRALSTRKNRTLLEAMMRQEGINEEAIAQLKDPEEAAAYFFQYYGYNTSFREDFLADPANAPAATVFQKLADWVDSVVNAVYKALGAKTNDQKALAMLDMLINGEAITNEDFEHRAIDRKLETNWNKFIRTTGPIIPGSRKVQFPATHFLRSLNSDAANKIADMFAPEPGSAHTGFMKDKQQSMSTYLNRFEDVIDGLNKEQLHALGVEASSMKPATSEKGAELQKLLNDLYDYQTKAGVATLNTENNEWVPLRRVENYGVRKWNPAAVSANKAGFIELMSQHMNAERAENLYSAIIAGDGAIETAQTENDLGYTPFHSSALSRQLTFITPENVQTFMPFIETDIREVMASYISQSVHRAEYTRAFGNGGALIARLMSQAQAEGVSSKDLGSMNAAVKSMQGTLDHPWASPTYKKAVGYAITVQNFALLPLIIFSSMFTDPMGVAVRTGEYKKAGKTMLAGLNQVVRDVRKLDKTKRERLARRLGIVAEDNLLDAMGQSAHSMNMSTSVRKANSKFFAYTGIAALTKGLRIGAMGVGMDFIIESVGNKAKMEELGLNDSDVHTYTAEDGEVELAVTKEQIVQALVAKSTGNVDPASFDAIAEAAELKISKALYNFVDSSIVRPNAAHRPAWASDPRFQIFAYLKQYTWSFREVIVQQAKVRSERDGSAVPIFALMSFVPLMLISDVLRGEIFGTNKGTADIGGMMLGSLARSGVMGVGTFGLDAIEDYNRGGVMNAAAGALGPVADHAGDVLGNFGGKISDERLAARTLPLGSLVRGFKRKYFPTEE